MRRICYSVAASLDGYIAGPDGEADWIVMDPEIDFRALFGRFDTVLLGRKTFEFALRQAGGGGGMGMRTIVFSRTLRAADHPGVTIVASKQAEVVAALKREPGRDIWLMGGGDLFRSLLELGLVDTVEVSIVPVVLGGGLPLAPAPCPRTQLVLKEHRVYSKTGIVSLAYEVKPARARSKARTERA